MAMAPLINESVPLEMPFSTASFSPIVPITLAKSVTQAFELHGHIRDSSSSSLDLNSLLESPCMLFLQWLAGKNHPMVLQYSGLVCRTSVPRVVKSKGHPVTYPQRVPKHDRNCQELWVLGKTMRGFVHACTSPYSLALTEFNALRVRILFI